MGGNCSASCQIAGLGPRGFKPFGSATRVLVT